MACFSQHDIEILRHLAGKFREMAARPDMAEKRKAWFSHNDLKPDRRPMVLCFPEGAWREITPTIGLQCEDNLARGWEFTLRAEMYQADVIGDDRPLEPFFNIHWVFHETGWGIEMHQDNPNQETGASHWDSVISCSDDIKKLKPNLIEVDEEETDRQCQIAEDVFGGILSVRRRCGFLSWMGQFIKLIRLRNMSDMMMDMALQPEFLLELVNFLVDTQMKNLDILESGGYLTLNNENDYAGSGGVGYTRDLPAEGFQNSAVRLIDRWGCLEAQELVNVSPEMFERFFIEPHLKLAERVGLLNYGCCEPIHDRLAAVFRLPNLRRLSISPWCDVNIAAKALGGNYIFSHKPNPSFVCQPTFAEEECRRTLREAMTAARQYNCPYETILKDTHTVCNEPKRLARWVQIARETIDEIYG